MTGAQRSKYWSLWAAACRANGWEIVYGLAIVPGQARTKAAGQVVELATDGHPQGRCRIPADRLRHACHQAVLGRDKSSTEMTNKDLDQVYAFFRHLANPLDLAAAAALADPEAGERRRIVHRLQKSAPEAYLDSICRDRFSGVYHSPHWEDLPMPALRQLAMTVSERKDHFRRPVEV